MENQKFDYFFKVLIVGKWDTGKSSILARFSENKFTENYKKTKALDHCITDINVEDNNIRLQVWDLAGTSSIRG